MNLPITLHLIFPFSSPHGARVSGVVEETPGRLEYEVALYKEAPPINRINNNVALGQLKNQTHTSEVPVDQAVPIGTKLQLRARISAASVWKYVKLMEVTVSPDPDDPHSAGSVWLIREGCRNRDFSSIIPHQPARYRDRSNEVFLDFEAFLLSSMKERSTLWIHSQIKACMDAADCQPDFCLDLFDPSGTGGNFICTNERRVVLMMELRALSGNLSGHGKRRRSIADKNATEYTKFKENIEYTVIMPGEFENGTKDDQCRSFLLIALLLGLLLALSTVIVSEICSRIAVELMPSFADLRFDNKAPLGESRKSHGRFHER